uniref:Uncharacterized protein n=1 Tax=Anguilla anguilla TaxID=7936 RepID=A0A0E9Q1T8_ANGAN
MQDHMQDLFCAYILNVYNNPSNTITIISTVLYIQS